MIYLKIGPVKLEIDGLEESQLPKNTLLFLSDNDNVNLHYRIKIREEFPAISHPIIYQKHDIVVFRKASELESRLMLLPDKRMAYAYYEEMDANHITVYFNPFFIPLLSCDTIFYSLLALERHLSKLDSFVYHCAYMDFDGKAVLFSGPSGMGKSTQSNLWCKVFPGRAKVLNGDKCLLIKENGKYYAVGWPICGSSGICYNEKREVAAIVLLQQYPTNQEIPEKRIRQFKRILEQLAVNYWNPPFVNKAMSFAENLSGWVPCCTYACNMEDEAATTLYTLLQTKINEKD